MFEMFIIYNIDLLLLVTMTMIVMVAVTVWMIRHRQEVSFIIGSWLLLLAILFIGILRVEGGERQQRRFWGDSFKGMTHVFADATEKFGHYKIRQGEDYDPEVYDSIIKLHEKWARDVEAVGYIFTFRRIGPKQVEYICSCSVDLDGDGKSTGKELGDPPFTPYMEEGEYAWYDVYQEGFEGRIALDDSVHSLVFGDWVTCVAPLHDPEGRIEGILGVDFRIEKWQEHIRLMRYKTVQLLTLICLLYLSGLTVLAYVRNSLKKARSLNDKLLEAQGAARVAAKAKADFLANMSHEIRTPMNAILGLTDILRLKVPEHYPPEARQEAVELVQLVRKNGEELLTIINNILEFTKSDSLRRRLNRIPFSPRALIVDVMSVENHEAQRKGIRTELTIAPSVPEAIYNDASKIRHLLTNIIINAIKFTERGSVHVHVTAEAITAPIQTFDDDDEDREYEGDSTIIGVPGPTPVQSEVGWVRIRIDVTDTGIGMSSEQIVGIFRPFAQADTTSTRKYSGIGLGLAVSKELTAMLGGDLRIESELGKGTTCTLLFDSRVTTLPMDESIGSSPGTPIPPTRRRERATIPQQRWHDRSASDSSQITGTPGDGTDEKQLAGLRILLVEDMVINQLVMTSLLHDAGADVEIAENGQIGLDKVKEQGEFDVILMDMQMPVLDGYEATRQLRESGYEGVIVAVTAHALSGDREKTLEVGCDDYLPKPVDRQLLIQTLLRKLQERNSSRKGENDDA